MYDKHYFDVSAFSKPSIFHTAKKPNLFFVQRKSGIIAISVGIDENIGKTFR